MADINIEKYRRELTGINWFNELKSKRCWREGNHITCYALISPIFTNRLGIEKKNRHLFCCLLKHSIYDLLIMIY